MRMLGSMGLPGCEEEWTRIVPRSAERRNWRRGPSHGAGSGRVRGAGWDAGWSAGATPRRLLGAVLDEPAAPGDRVGGEGGDPHRDQCPFGGRHRPDGGQELVGAGPVDDAQERGPSRRQLERPLATILLLDP